MEYRTLSCAGWDLQDAPDWPRPDWDEFRTHLYDVDGVCAYTRRADVLKPVIRGGQRLGDVVPLARCAGLVLGLGAGSAG